MKNLLIPSSILVLVGWGYAIFLYSQLNLPPTESYGDSDWKSQFISTMRSSEQCHLIARRTGVSCSSVQETLDYITQDIHQIHTNGIQYSTALALQRFHPPSPHHHRINHTSLVFPQDYSPIYGQPSKDSKFVLIYLSSKPMSLDLYRQFIHTLRSTGYHGDIIIGLTPSEYSQPQYKTYFSNENIIIYPYLINCTLTTAVVENSQLCFLYDSSR